MTGEWENQFAGWEESSERVGISDYRKTGKNSLKNSERTGDMAQRWQALATFRGPSRFASHRPYDTLKL